jgi:glyoxylase-like metal-dependent hydrolase (beta-lactamase superfamily II)
MWIRTRRCHDGQVGTDIDVRRIDFGYFIRPGSETASGQPRVEPVLGYLVRHARGLLLFDTGMGADPEVDEHYQPRRVELADALTAAGESLETVAVAANCHLHFDHCGGNPQLAGRPIVVQRQELETARGANYTLPELVDGPGLQYDEINGEAEVWPGVTVLATPGHVDGHQSLVVRRSDGTVIVLAGQGHDTATDFGADALAVHAHAAGHPGAPAPSRDWVHRLLQLDPKQVYFAHDHSVWTPS